MPHRAKRSQRRFFASVARPSWVAVMRVIRATGAVLHGMAFITVGAKRGLVAMSIVQTSKTIKSGALCSKAQDHTLVEARFNFCGWAAEDGVDDKQYIA